MAAPSEGFAGVHPAGERQYGDLLDDIIQGGSPTLGEQKMPRDALDEVFDSPAINDTQLGSAEQRMRLQFVNRLDRKHRRLQTSRADLQLLRSQVKVSWDRFQRFEDKYRESRRAYEFSMDRTHNRRVTSAGGLRLLREQFNEDRRRLETQYEEASSLEQRVAVMEEDLKRRDASFVAAAREFVDSTSRKSHEDLIAQLATARQEMTGTPLSMSSTGTRLDPRLERYYDRAGDVKIMAERLLELEHQHNEELVTRGIRQDRDEVLSITDEDFDRDYSRKYTITDQELQIAIKDADDLREDCIKAGLDIDAWKQKVSPSDDAALSVSDADDAQAKLAPQIIPASDDLSRLLQLDSWNIGDQNATTYATTTSDLLYFDSIEQDPVAAWVVNVDEDAPADSIAADEDYYTKFSVLRSDAQSVPAISRKPSSTEAVVSHQKQRSESHLPSLSAPKLDHAPSADSLPNR